MSAMPSVIDPDLLRELLGEQVGNGEITRAEAVQCWNLHALPVLLWERERCHVVRACAYCSSGRPCPNVQAQRWRDAADRIRHDDLPPLGDPQ